jgi:hypothetical protein
MKSYEQLGRTAHAAWAQSKQAPVQARRTTWEQLHPEVQQCWIAIAKAVAAEVATIL